MELVFQKLLREQYENKSIVFNQPLFLFYLSPPTNQCIEITKVRLKSISMRMERASRNYQILLTFKFDMYGDIKKLPIVIDEQLRIIVASMIDNDCVDKIKLIEILSSEDGPYVYKNSQF